MTGASANLKRDGPEARAAIGRAVGRLNIDNRRGVGLLVNGIPDIDWVEIRGGEFIYQKDERRSIETFFIARYLVTNLQFQAFLSADDGYREDRWWDVPADPWYREPAVPAWTEPNHPRETVRWFEAMAFCEWLSYRLNRKVRLPKELEWERTARGRQGRQYPWGDEFEEGRCHIDEVRLEKPPLYLSRTSAVGLYPEGASEDGVLDLSGNVWEWCLDDYDQPDCKTWRLSSPRVVRGGSWRDDLGSARASYRGREYLQSRDHSVGFRVVCSSPL